MSYSAFRKAPAPTCIAAFAMLTCLANLTELRGQTTAPTQAFGNPTTLSTRQGPSLTPGRASTIVLPSASSGLRQGNAGFSYAARAAQTARAQSALNSLGTGNTPRGNAAQSARGYGGSALPVNIVNLGSPSSTGNSAAAGDNKSGDAGSKPTSATATSPAAPQDNAEQAVRSRSGPLALGFDLSRAPPNQAAIALAKRLSKLPSLHFLTEVQVEIVGRQAVLRGRVASEHDRDLAARVVLLEASVDEVVNLLEVGPA